KEDGIFISQDKYVDEILNKFGYSDVKTASTPMETHKTLLKDEKREDVDEHLHRSMIGSLMYLTSSRPDIMFAVCACVRFQVNPKISHLYAVKKIFRYLKCQPKLGLWYPKDSPSDLLAYTDCDYARASLDRKSTTGGKENAAKDKIVSSAGNLNVNAVKKQKQTERKVNKNKEKAKANREKRRFNDQEDAEMLFDVNDDLQVEEVADKEVSATKEVNTARITTYVSTVAITSTTPTIFIVEITLAKALIEIKKSRPKERGVVMQDPTETPTPTPILKNKSFNEVQKAFDKSMSWIDSFVHMDTEVVKESSKLGEVEVQESSSKRVRDELEQENAKKQRTEDDNESVEPKGCLEIVLDDGDIVTIKATPLSSKLKKDQERDKIGSKPDKKGSVKERSRKGQYRIKTGQKGKRGKAEKCQKQLE
nr:uncharacterized mitochondrial protein AtMg00810-like [Tanacetum cinerariifolium]